MIRLKCVLEKNKLRIRIISKGYNPNANCMFPKDIRIDGREYLVPPEDISFEDSRGKFFYRIRKGRIEIVSEIPTQIFTSLECCVCLVENDYLIIFFPCGHSCCCTECSQKLNKCPLCRKDISRKVNKEDLQ